MRWTWLALTIGCGLTLSATPAAARQAAPAAAGRPVPDRDYITARIAELRRIHTPEGIESLEQVSIAGTQQWVSIRGLHRDNPVILFIHGGPGTPMMPMTWAYQGIHRSHWRVVDSRRDSGS